MLLVRWRLHATRNYQSTRRVPARAKFSCTGLVWILNVLAVDHGIMSVIAREVARSWRTTNDMMELMQGFVKGARAEGITVAVDRPTLLDEVVGDVQT